MSFISIYMGIYGGGSSGPTYGHTLYISTESAEGGGVTEGGGSLDGTESGGSLDGAEGGGIG